MNQGEAELFLAFMIGKVGEGFHPDSYLSDYIDGRISEGTIEPLFTEEECKLWQPMLDSAHDVLSRPIMGNNIYDVARKLFDRFYPKEDNKGGADYCFKTMIATIGGIRRPMRIASVGGAEGRMVDVWSHEEKEWIWSDEATAQFKSGS
jgi:hypothetical protein